MIRLAKMPEIAHVLAISRLCAIDMQRKGIFQWNEHYPSEAAFTKDVKRKELYVLIENAAIVGAIVITTVMDEEYMPVQWLTPNENNIYIHRLCVHPEFQGRGYAQEMMRFAESMAKETSRISVRLDTFSQNTRNQTFYEKRGYQRLGDIYLPKQSKYPFHCYELLL